MKLGDYETLEEVGAGAFGTTFRARHRVSGDVVALKRLRLAGLEEWKPVERFEREARALRSLSHPGVVRFIEAFDAKDEQGYSFCLVSEFIDGPTLGQKIVDGDRWSEDQARALLEQLLETLHYLHGLSPRVVHRDIKPGNIVLSKDDRPILIDFGAVADFTPSGGDGGPTVAGTAGYMAPEQALGAVDHRSDLYGLGATLLHVLTHVHPIEFPRDGLNLDLRSQLGCSEDLIAILARLLEANPVDRFQSAGDALAALREETPEGTSEPRALARKETTALVPVSPRALTPEIRSAVTMTRNVGPGTMVAYLLLTMLGAGAFAMISVATANLGVMILGLLSPVLLLLGFMGINRSRALSLYVMGRTTEGTIRAIESDDRSHRVTYDYVVDGERREGKFSTRDLLSLRSLDKGDPLHVFYDEHSPGRSMALLPSELGSDE